MSRWSIVALSGALMTFAAVDVPTQAAAFDYQLSGPVTANNLGVYFVDGSGPGGSAMMSLDQAAAQGAVKIYQQQVSIKTDSATGRSVFVNGPVAMENLSAQSVFIQLGDLVKGGLQDQVVLRSTILPPHSGRVFIDTLCVDPFRSTARTGDSAQLFSAPGALFPWRLAKVIALAGNSSSAVAQMNVQDVRQLGIWWSMDTLRAKLGQALGVPLEPATAAYWDDKDQDPRVNAQLAARRSHWKNSLPLSLQNPQLARALLPYTRALEAKARRGETVGAVFVINGQIVGADIYRSHELFLQMWPKLLRAYATEAVAGGSAKPGRLPVIRRVREFLAAAERAPAKELDAANVIGESTAAIYAVTSSGGAWVYRSYIAKQPAAVNTPEGAIVNILETGTVGGRAIGSLDDSEMIVLHDDHSAGGFTGSVEGERKNTEIGQVPIRLLHSRPVTDVGQTSFNDRWSATVEDQTLTNRLAQLDNQARSLGGPSQALIDFALLVLVALAYLLSRLLRRGRSAKASVSRLAVAAREIRRRVVTRLQQMPAQIRRQEREIAPAVWVAPQRAVAREPVPHEPVLQQPPPLRPEPERPAPRLAAADPPTSLSAYRQWRAATAAGARPRNAVPLSDPADRAEAA